MGFNGNLMERPSGKRLQQTMERSTMLLMGKLTISMVIFNSYVKLPEGNGCNGDLMVISWD